MSTDTSATSLTACLARIGAGDREGLKVLYGATSGRLFALSLRFMGQRDAAEDVLQDVYLTVWRKAKQFDPGRGDAMAWLNTIVRSKALDAIRRRPAAAGSLTEVERLPDLPARAAMEAAAAAPQLQRGLDRLSAKNARAIRSIYFEGLSYRDLAEREQAPIATVKSWVQRSLVQMRRSLEPTADMRVEVERRPERALA